MFILRTFFWLAVVVMILPTGKSDGDVTDTTATGVSMTDTPGFDTNSALDAAATAVGDLSSFCTRNPGACETGAAAAEAFKAKTKDAVRMLYDWATGGDAETSSGIRSQEDVLGKTANMYRQLPANFFTGTVHLASGKKSKSQNTLRIEDIIPEWTGPSTNRTA